MQGFRLDWLLSVGYFRTQQDMFTCRLVRFGLTTYPAHWLRIVLDRVQYGPKQRRLFRINEAFSVVVKPFALTSELEDLYRLYRSSIDFDASETVESCLLAGSSVNIFDTYVVEVRDKDQLIAVGIFDNGDQSIAGIMNFYHPAYRKYSLGKYLMLLKMEHARRQNKTYYYPGYLISFYAKFDYKLFACEAATEVYDDSRRQWLPFSWPMVNVLAEEIMNG